MTPYLIPATLRRVADAVESYIDWDHRQRKRLRAAEAEADDLRFRLTKARQVLRDALSACQNADFERATEMLKSWPGVPPRRSRDVSFEIPPKRPRAG